MFLAEQWHCTPWEVRENVTLWDLLRTGMMNLAKSEADTRKSAMDHQREVRNNSSSKQIVGQTI